MKPTLILQPIHNSSTDILKTFRNGKPLSSDQLNFIASHERELSSSEMDPLLKYYLESEKKHRKHFGSFLLPHEELNKQDIEKLKLRIIATLKDKYSHVVVEATEKQFKQFKQYTFAELVNLLGYEFISSPQFYQGAIPAIFFQWVDLFGIWKYVMIHEAGKLRSTSILYFENMNNREFQKCVDDYKERQKNEITHQKKIYFEEKKIIETEPEKKIQQPRLTHHYHIDHLEK